MPAGRPTEYRPEHCAAVVEHCADGRSLASFCADLDISRQTLYQWRAKHPEFDDACSRALIRAQKWFEEQCRGSLGDRNFNSRLAEFMMAARFEDYRPQAQRVEIEHKGQVNVRSLTRDELVRLASQVVDVEEVKPPEIAESSQPSSPDNANET